MVHSVHGLIPWILEKITFPLYSPAHFQYFGCSLPASVSPFSCNFKTLVWLNCLKWIYPEYSGFGGHNEGNQGLWRLEVTVRVIKDNECRWFSSG